MFFGSDDDLHEEDPLEYDSGFGNIIVVDNLPVVPREKFEKLEGVVRKIYSQIGVIKEDGLWMPVDSDTQKTLGYCFIEYNTPQVSSPFYPFSTYIKKSKEFKSSFFFDFIDDLGGFGVLIWGSFPVLLFFLLI